LLFGPARELAGRREADVTGTTAAEVLAAAVERFGPAFGELAGRSGLWVNGEPAGPQTPVADGDEVAVLPPVSGG
jgi:molybdopterin converting factor small subunit